MRRFFPSLIAVFVAISVAWAAASYPTSVKVFTTKTTGETIAAAHVNDLQDEIVAIEQGLLNGFAHALKPSTDAGQTLGTSALRWKQALLGLGTVTVDTPALDITGAWNAVAVAFTGIKANFTDTASAVASLLLDLQVGGVSKFKVDKAGNVDVGTSVRMGTNPATTGTIRFAHGDRIFARDSTNSFNRAIISWGSPVADHLIIGDSSLAVRISSSANTPGTLSNGDWWVDCIGTSPSRVCAIKVFDGGATRTIASITY